MASKFNDDNDAIADINITPFVDIILVVLIIFMVTTPIIMNPSINIQLPKAVTGEETTPTQLTFNIAKTGQLYLNGKEINEQDILESVKAQVAKDPNVQAIIAADQDTSHGSVIKIIDLVKQAGVHKFAISTEKPAN